MTNEEILKKLKSAEEAAFFSTQTPVRDVLSDYFTPDEMKELIPLFSSSFSGEPYTWENLFWDKSEGHAIEQLLEAITILENGEI